MSIPDSNTTMWPTYDKRLPTEIDRALDQEYYDFVANIRKRKIIGNPLWMGKLGQSWQLLAGRARLLAARQLLQEGMKVFAYVPVRVFILENEDEAIALRLSENAARSKNAAADYLAIRKMLLKTNDYKIVAEKLGIPVKDVRWMDVNLGPVPVAILEGVLAGKVALTTAIKVGKIQNDKTKKAMVRLLNKNGELLGWQVDETRSAIRAEAMGTLGFMNEVEDPKRASWTRAEILTALNLAKAENAERTAQFLLGLVS